MRSSVLGGLTLCLWLLGCRSEDVHLGPAILPGPDVSTDASAPDVGKTVACGTNGDWQTLLQTAPSFADDLSLFVSSAELESVRSQLVAGRGPAADVVDPFWCDASAALEQDTLSVTLVSDPSHTFSTQEPNCGWPAEESPCGESCCAGTWSPYADREDYFAAIALGNSVRNLGLAYRLTGVAAYAEQAIDLLNAWFVDADTRVLPEYNGSQLIELFITLPGIYYGAQMVMDNAAWAASDRDALLRWARDFHEQHQDPTGLAAICQQWQLVNQIATAALLDDTQLIEQSISSWTNMLRDTMELNGALPGNLENATLTLNALTQIAEIARHNGRDVYDDQIDAKNLELAFDYHAPFAAAPDTYPGELGRAHTNWSVYELAYRRWHKAKYLDVIEAIGRPLTESRSMGPVSLTHGVP